MMNIDNKVGACGAKVGTYSITAKKFYRLNAIFVIKGLWLPEFLHDRLLPMEVIKINRETGEPIRGPDGLCINVDFGKCLCKDQNVQQKYV